MRDIGGLSAAALYRRSRSWAQARRVGAGSCGGHRRRRADPAPRCRADDAVCGAAAHLAGGRRCGLAASLARPTIWARWSASWPQPSLLLPQLGMIRGTAVTGIVNLAAAGVVSIFLLRHVVSGRQLVTALCALARRSG